MSVFSSAWRFAAVPVVLMVAAPASAQLLQRKDLSYPMALTIATGALEDCKAKGYAVSVVVVDRGGDVMVALRAHDPGPHTMENARRKAYTARTFKMTSEEFAKRMETEPVRRQQATLPGVIGVPAGPAPTRYLSRRGPARFWKPPLTARRKPHRPGLSSRPSAPAKPRPVHSREDF